MGTIFAPRRHPHCDCAVHSGFPEVCSEEIHPLIDAVGWRAFEIDGEVDGREYVGKVLLCPDCTARMDDFIARKALGQSVQGLQFHSFGGGRKKEPEWV